VTISSCRLRGNFANLNLSSMPHLQRFSSLPFILYLSFAAAAQTPPAPEPDSLLLIDGEKLIGHFIRSTGGTVRFKSDALGEVNVEWSKVKELHSASQFAVVTKGIRIGRKSGTADVSEGAISEANQKIEVGNKTIPVAEATQVIDVATFNKDVAGSPGFFKGWHGTATLAASFVEATQNSRAVTDSIALVRAVPGEDWLARHDRTAFDFSSSYGLLSQPNSRRSGVRSTTPMRNATTISRQCYSDSARRSSITIFRRVSICSRLTVAARGGVFSKRQNTAWI